MSFPDGSVEISDIGWREPLGSDAERESEIRGSHVVPMSVDSSLSGCWDFGVFEDERSASQGNPTRSATRYSVLDLYTEVNAFQSA